MVESNVLQSAACFVHDPQLRRALLKGERFVPAGDQQVQPIMFVGGNVENENLVVRGDGHASAVASDHDVRRLNLDVAFGLELRKQASGSAVVTHERRIVKAEEEPA